jgi:hypothetical protein
MRKVNYKSDFDFIIKLKDPRDNTKTVPFPECDFDSILWTSNKSTAYRFSCQNGKYVNCFLETDGGLHVVVNNHRLGKGMLRWEPHFKFPNGLYPDFIRDTNNLELLGIELVDWADSCPLNAVEVEATLPAVYLTAYDLAVRNGYAGTYEDFVEYTNRFPQVVESAETVNALLSDFADGKALIANALTRQGADTSASESMQSMADKVLGLQLAVEGDPQYVEHDSRVGGYDLYNVMHNHKKAEFPYMYAVSFNAPTVTLSGADAYLCSDGYYTEQSGIHKMPFAQEHYVIYYFRNKSFALTATAARYINEMCVYNGAPIVNFSNVEVRRLAIYGDELFSTDNESAFSIVGGYLAEVAIETLESGYVQIRAENSVSVRTPNLKNLRGGVLLNYLGRIQSQSLPSLATVSGGTIANSCAALAELALLNVEIVDIKSEFYVSNECVSLSMIRLPHTIRIESLIYGNRGFRVAGGNTSKHIVVLLPICVSYQGTFLWGKTRQVLCELQFGNAVESISTSCENYQILAIKIGKGAVTFLDSSNANWDTEALKQFIADLGDNTDGETKQLRIGASEIAKLSEEDIALAVAKNYSLS